MLDEELVTATFEVLIGGKGVEALHERAVCCCWIGVRGCTCVVQSCKDTRWSLFFYQITHDFVIEVIDRRPFDLFADILLLFRLECELDEDLPVVTRESLLCGRE